MKTKYAVLSSLFFIIQLVGVLLLVAGNTFFSQYPDVVLLVFGNLINQVVEKRVRVV